MPEKIMLIDGNSIINRAFYALPPLTNKDGDYTNGVYGFLNMFFKFYDEENPSKVVVTFDVHAPTKRHLQYAEYKGTRKSMPMELRPQIPLLKELLKKMHIPVYELEGYEADDLLGTLAVKAERQGMDVTVISGDRDLLQMASDHIRIRIPKTKGGKTEVEDYYKADVIDKLGVTPEEYIDVKALMGDSSDNVPGVPSIGEKTAFKIIQEYKSLENAMANAEQIKPKKASENLTAYKEQALLSKELVTIITDAPVEIPENMIESSGLYSQEALLEVRRLEFKSLLPRFNDGGKADGTTDTSEKPNARYRLIIQPQDGQKAVEEYLKEKSVAVDIVFFQDSHCGVSLYSENMGGCFAPFDNQENIDDILKIFAPLFASDIPKVALDSKKDKVFLGKKGIILNNVIFDCMLAGYVLNASSDTYYYDDIARDFLNLSYPRATELSGKGKGRLDFYQLTDQQQLDYACRQTETIYQAYPVMLKEIEEKDQKDLYYDIELPLADVLANMELNGIKVNKEALITYDKLLSENIDILVKQIYELAGEEFNINSPKQMGSILFEKLGMKGGKKTKTGYSTAADVLEKLRYESPIVDLILQYRTLAKLKSTYCDGLLNVLDEETHKIFSTFNQAVTSTGRISSTEPNLQNIPIRMEIGRELRKVFIPTDDSYVFVDGDYSQIELRILAHISGDETMIDAFRHGADIHRITASQVLRIPLEEVTPEQRSSAKAVNFGIVYGIGGYSLSQDIGVSVKEADQYIQSYFEKYPKVKAYLDDTVAKARQDGYAATIFNRRRSIPELNAGNFVQRSFGERVAMNMPIQGSAADIIKIAMVKVYRRLKSENCQSRIILQVHDELLLEVKRAELAQVQAILKEEMEQAVALSVPLDVDIHTGETWFEAK